MSNAPNPFNREEGLKMPDEKKGYNLSGAIWDTVFNGEESDRSYDRMPEMPDGLVEKTMEAIKETARLEIARNIDPRYIPASRGHKKTGCPDCIIPCLRKSKIFDKGAFHIPLKISQTAN